MTEPLVVDPTRLKSAGNELQNQVFPPLPSPIAVTGADSISAAINETLPIIESPVIDGLPKIKAALNRTASSVVTAADLYAETDQRLGNHVARVPFLADAEDPVRAASATRLAADHVATDEPAQDEATTPPAAAEPFTGVVPQLGQLTGPAGTLGTVAQSVMQSTQGTTGRLPAAGPMSSQTADDREPDGEEEPLDALAEAAAPGDQALDSVPIEPSVHSSSSAPRTAPSPI